MKKFLLMLAVMLLTCATSFAERTWLRPAVQSVQTDGEDQYFYNVEYGGFLCAANEWGTRASVARDKGMPISVTQVDMAFRFGQMSPDNPDGVWVDGNRDGNKTFHFVLLEETDRFNIINEKFEMMFLTWTGDESNTRLNFTESPDNGTWYSVSVEEFNRYMEEDLEAVKLYFAALPLKDLLEKSSELNIDDSSERAVYNNDEATIEQLNDAIASLTAKLKEAQDKIDEAQGIFTGRIVNNTVTGATGWTCERPVGGNGPMLNGTAFEYWGGNASSRQDAGFNYYQKIAGLPAGKYVLGAEMYNASNGEGENHEPNGNAGLYIANGETEEFVGVTEDGTDFVTYQTQEINVYEGDDITIGVKSIGYMSARWFVADNFTLVRTGDADAPAPVVAIEEGEGTYTITSTSETAALYYLCKPMSWLDEGETPESCLQADIEGMGSMIDSEETWELYDHMGMQPAPKTFTVADYEEMYAGEEMFLIAANVGWDGEKLAVISNIEQITFTVSEDEEEETDDYNTTVEVAKGEGSAYITDVIKIGEKDYNAYKIGTSKATGSINVTVPAGSTGLSFYALSWGTAETEVTATCGEATETYTATGAGISGNSPYTYDAEKGGEPSEHLYTFDFGAQLEEDAVVSLTAPARIVFFGLNPVQAGAGMTDDEAAEIFMSEYESLSQQFTQVYNTTVNAEEYQAEEYAEVIEEMTPVLNSIQQNMATRQTWAMESYEAGTLATDLEEILASFEDIQIQLTQFFNRFNEAVAAIGSEPELANADFAEGVLGDVNIATYEKDGTPNQMQEVPGWSLGVENGDARAAGVVAYGSGTTLGGSAYTVPAAGPEGTNGNALAMVGVWTGTVKYTQDVELPAGKYTMTVPVYNTAGTSAFVKNLIGVTVDGVETLATTTVYPVGKWIDETVVFELAEDATVTVSLGYEGANVGSGSSQHLFLDCVKIEAYDELAVAKAAAIAALPEGNESIFTPSAEEVAEIKAAIEAATTAEEVEAAAAAELTIPALAGEYTILNTTAEGYLGTNEDGGIVLSADEVKVTFEQAENGFYIKVGEEYVSMVGTDKNVWSMGATPEPMTAWNFNLVDGDYTIQGANGVIGTDNVEAGSACYANKTAANNGVWTIAEVVVPEIAVTLLNGEEDGYTLNSHSIVSVESATGIEVRGLDQVMEELTYSIFTIADGVVAEGTLSVNTIGYAEFEEPISFMQGSLYTVTINAGETELYSVQFNGATVEEGPEVGEVAVTYYPEGPVLDIIFKDQTDVAPSFTEDILLNGEKLNCQMGQEWNEIYGYPAEPLVDGEYTLVFPAGSLMLNSKDLNTEEVTVTFTVGEPTPAIAMSNMSLTVAEGETLDEDGDFKVTFNYTATLNDESLTDFSHYVFAAVYYTVYDAAGEVAAKNSKDFQLDETSCNLFVSGLEAGKEYNMVVDMVEIMKADWDFISVDFLTPAYDAELPTVTFTVPEAAPELADCDLTNEMFFKYYSNTTGEALAEPETIGCDYNVGTSTGMVFGLSTVKWYAYADVTGYDKLVISVTEGTPRVMFNREIDPAKNPEADGINHVEITGESPYLTIMDCGDGSKNYVYDLKAMAAADPAKPFVHINAIKGANWANTTVTGMKLFVTDEAAQDYLTGIGAIELASKANGKYIENGKIVIVKNGVKYNVAGSIIK